MEYFHENGNIEDEVGVLNEMCKVYEVTGNFENGITTIRKSINLIDAFFKNKPSSAAKRNSSGMTFFWLSRLYIIAGDYEGALSVIRKARQYYPDPIDSFSKSSWMAMIGDVHRLLGNYDSAMYYLKGFQNSNNTPNNFGKISLGYLYLDLKEYSKAQSLILPYYQNLKSIHRITNPIAKALNIVGNASLGEKKYEQALQYAKEAQGYLKQMDGRVLMISNYKLLSDIYSNLKVPDSAYAYLKQYTSLKDSLINRQFYFKLNSLKSESEEQKKTSMIQLLQKDNQLKQQLLIKGVAETKPFHIKI
jgi:tetratricopeptide (TPR) repeat protein